MVARGKAGKRLNGAAPFHETEMDTDPPPFSLGTSLSHDFYDVDLSVHVCVRVVPLINAPKMFVDVITKAQRAERVDTHYS